MVSQNKENSSSVKKQPQFKQNMEDALKFSESRYRRVFETARDGILLLNFETAQIEDANPFLIELLGYSLKEFQGKKLWEICPFKDVGLNKNAFAELRQKGYIRYEDLPLETKRGKKIQVEFVSNVYDCEGTKVIQCNVRDITERKLAEAEYRTIIRTTMDGFLITDMQGRFLDMNDAYCRIIGYGRNELLEMSLLDVNTMDTPEVISEHLRKVRENGHDRFDTMHRRKDGTVLDLDISINFMPDGGGRMIAFVRDITERKRTELALQQEKVFSDAVIGSAPGVFFVTDQQGNLIRWNSYLNNLTKHLGEEPGKTSALYIVHDDDKERINSKLDEVFRTGSAHAEARILCHDHGVRNYFLSARRFELDGVAYLTGFGIDNTELKQAQDALFMEKAFLEATIESAPGAFFVIDMQQNLVRWNSFVSNVTGLSDEQLRGSSILSCIYEQDHPLATAIILAAFATGHTQKIELRVQTREHGLRIFLKTLHRFEVGGELYLAGFGIDVTERKLIENALTKEKEFSDALIESMPGAFFVVDPEGNYLRWNSYLNRLTGLTDAQLLHMPSLLTIQQEDRPIAAATMKKSFETGYSKAELHILTHERGSRVFLMTTRRFKVEDSFYLVGVGVDTTDRQADAQELELKAFTDPLTGLSNRGHFMVMAEQELDRSRRYGHPLSLWMLDIDHFKNVNDTYGHHAGDLALQSLVDVSNKVLREMDIMGRVGGEEFAVLLPETDTEQALLVAERLRQKIAATDVHLEQGKTVRYTVSIGVATLGEHETGIDALLQRADQALYHAKKTGRDKVCIADSNVGVKVAELMPT
jgi:diguanylate cyclase (GGDEF)-like protein/PAS domain S-box-containing protein